MRYLNRLVTVALGLNWWCQHRWSDKTGLVWLLCRLVTVHVMLDTNGLHRHEWSRHYHPVLVQPVILLATNSLMQSKQSSFKPQWISHSILTAQNSFSKDLQILLTPDGVRFENLMLNFSTKHNTCPVDGWGFLLASLFNSQNTSNKMKHWYSPHQLSFGICQS